jgi:hypothetical protein
MNKFSDKDIYEKAKEIIYKQFEKASAYRSMALVKNYKEMGGKISKANKESRKTNQWLKEKWVNLTPVALSQTTLTNAPPCGVKGNKQGNNPSICRPTVKINKTTPELAQNYNKQQLIRALETKKEGKQIKWNKL